MDGEDELIDTGRRRARWILPGAMVLVALLGLAAVVHVFDHGAAPEPRAARSASPPRVAPPPSSALTPWPTAPAACGDAQLPIVSSVAPATRTKLSVLVGSGALRRVDFDSGRRSTLGPTLRRGEHVSSLGGGYAVTSSCAGTRRRIFHIGRPIDLHALAAPTGTLFGDGATGWVGFLYPDDAQAVIADGPHGVRRKLPNGFYPVAVTDGVAVGGQPDPNDVDYWRVVLVDARRAAVRADLGYGTVVAAGHGEVVWDQGCTLSEVQSCMLHARALTGGPIRTYRLPRAPGGAVGAVSPDGRRIAFTLPRPHPDPHLDPGYPLLPDDIAVLNLDTGRLDIVPGIELPAKETPGLTFSPDGRWLIVALDAGTRTRLLAWHEGLAHPYETRPVPGPALDTPPVIAVSHSCRERVSRTGCRSRVPSSSWWSSRIRPTAPVQPLERGWIPPVAS